MATADKKTVELRGGPADGRRIAIPLGFTELTLQVDSADKFSACASLHRGWLQRPCGVASVCTTARPCQASGTHESSLCADGQTFDGLYVDARSQSKFCDAGAP